jgi:hypothetical protein
VLAQRVYEINKINERNKIYENKENKIKIVCVLEGSAVPALLTSNLYIY